MARQEYNLDQHHDAYKERPEGRIRYYAHDGLGSVVALTNYEGEVKARYQYEAFGGLISGDLTDNPYGFTGKRFDDESDLYHFHFRQYDPRTGIWTSQDPIGIAGGINLYGYVQNDPINFIDPFGLFDAETTLEILNSTPTGQHIADCLISRGTDIVIAPAGSNPQAWKMDNYVELDESYSNDIAAVHLAHEGTHIADDNNWPKESDLDTFEREMRAFSNQIAVNNELGEPDANTTWASTKPREWLEEFVTREYNLNINEYQ